MSLGNWLAYWYESHSKPRIRSSTRETYGSCIRLHIIPEIGGVPLNKLTLNDLQQFYGRFKKSSVRPDGAYVSRHLPTSTAASAKQRRRRALQSRGENCPNHSGKAENDQF